MKLEDIIHSSQKLQLYNQINSCFHDFECVTSFWNTQFVDSFQALERTAKHLESAQRKRDLNSFTRKRLEKIKRGLEGQSDSLKSLIPIDELLVQFPISDKGAITPLFDSLFEQFGNVFRDWVWGAGEPIQSAKTIKKFGAQQKQDVLFVGAGACRVPYEWHLQNPKSYLVAMEYNPLLFSVAKPLIEGKEVHLYEFPNRPLDLKNTVFGWDMKAQKPVNENFQLLLADFREPVFQDESFDLVITNWFIDIVFMPVEHTIRRINRLLRPGGTWVNHGPLLFNIEDLLNNLTQDEVLSLVEDWGFKIEKSTSMETPYHLSPHESQHRTDTLLVFQATKMKGVGAPPDLRRAAVPKPQDMDRPIAKSQDIQTLSQTFKLRGFILDLVDGQSSINSITDEILQQSPHFSREDILALVKDTIQYAEAPRHSEH